METEIRNILGSLVDTHWGKRILAAVPNGFTNRDLDAVDSWITCACGNLTHAIDRYGGSKAPKDSHLYHLGMWFSDAVKANERITAAELLVRIENRAIELCSNRSK